ncbi:hypothetical protein [Actinoplanes ianthinogenes]|uniref:hypothetical protein n=1 Tax=Actinoplanes ianthinogenes TaxID=122358 RepID=UPI00167159AC|nr:hypothetical protein [Actinoplanes ianthinogenes]
MSQNVEGAPEIRIGVFLAESGSPEHEVDIETDFDEGHVPAFGYKGRHSIDVSTRVVQLGNDVLRTAAEAVGREVALVVDGVVAGIEERYPADSKNFTIGDLELKFGVKATLGAGKAIEALLTASSEATVEVTLKLSQRQAANRQ